MKKILSILAIIALAFAGRAQGILGTNSFISTLSGWVVNNPPSDIFSPSNDVLELSSGALNNNNQQLQLYVDARLNVGNLFSLSPGGVQPFTGGVRFYNNSVLGTVTGVGGYVGYGIVNNSIRITPEIEFGYDTLAHAGYAAPTLMAEKAMTANTFTQIGINMHILYHGAQNYTPGVFVGAGFTF